MPILGGIDSLQLDMGYQYYRAYLVKKSLHLLLMTVGRQLDAKEDISRRWCSQGHIFGGWCTSIPHPGTKLEGRDIGVANPSQPQTFAVSHGKAMIKCTSVGYFFWT